LRLGAAIARPDLLARLNRFGWTPLPITAVVAGTASLEDPDLVTKRRKDMTAWRTDLVKWFNDKGYSTSASDASFFLVDVKRPGGDYIEALKDRGVHVGRVWQPYATAFRLTVGNPHEIAAFKKEFVAVEQALKNVPPTPASAYAPHEAFSRHDC
jgi:histidinol-phosphate aminotransferase